MAGKQSWAEKRWWHGTVFDWLAVLLGVALVLVLAAVALPMLLLRHTESRGLQDYYLNIYRSTCGSWERRTAKEYDPRRLQGVAVYVQAERSFSDGDRIQFTAPNN